MVTVQLLVSLFLVGVASPVPHITVRPCLVQVACRQLGYKLGRMVPAQYVPGGQPYGTHCRTASQRTLPNDVHSTLPLRAPVRSSARPRQHTATPASLQPTTTCLQQHNNHND